MSRYSIDVFRDHFSHTYLSEVIDTYLSPSTARGVDGVNYDRFLDARESEIKLISERALAGSYKFSPFRQKLIIKDAKSPPRQVSIPTIRDKVALRALNNFLSEVFNSDRPQHTHPVVSAAIRSISLATTSDAIIKLDVRSFYDDINHALLMKSLRKKIRSNEPLRMIEEAIATPTGVAKKEKVVNNVGVPQGLSISNILASIYMSSIDVKYQSILGLAYHRYVDDILCIAPAADAGEFYSNISRDLKIKKKLRVHALGSGKSVISPISDRIDYLGYSFHGGVVAVRKSTEKKIMSSLMNIIHGADQSNKERSIWRLNLRVSGCRLNGSNIGWMFYFSQINDLNLLARLDAQIRKAICARLGENDYKNCKRFIKAYHEVKYRFNSSKYHYNFDSFDRAAMAELLNRVFPGRFPNLNEKTEKDVRRIFNRVITREVREMERDTLGGFS